MPDRRKHRGKHSKDDLLFSDNHVPILQDAVSDLSWLLSRGYPENSSLSLVGNKYHLQKRQRHAVKRSACPDESLQYRRKTRIEPQNIKGRTVFIDGFNIIITIESALAGGYIFTGLDHSLSDLASVHGSYRKVEETEIAVRLILDKLNALKIGKAVWYLDSPVSNSGRLKKIIEFLSLSQSRNQNTEIHLVLNPDESLKNQDAVIITSDAFILDEVKTWFNLPEFIIMQEIPDARIIDLRKNK